MRRADLLTLSSLLYTLSLHLGGRAFGPPLCRGCAPATPPYKTISHRPCAFFATCLANSVSSPTCPLMPPPTAVPRSSPAVFPQFPCSSPQRPALASHLVHSSPATCLANSVSSPTCPLMPPPTAVPRSSPAVFPQFPCSSPQRPALASHLVHSSPATCLANSVSSPTCPLMPPPTAVPRSSPAVPLQFSRSSPAVLPNAPPWLATLFTLPQQRV